MTLDNKEDYRDRENIFVFIKAIGRPTKPLVDEKSIMILQDYFNKQKIKFTIIDDIEMLVSSDRQIINLLIDLDYAANASVLLLMEKLRSSSNNDNLLTISFCFGITRFHSNKVGEFLDMGFDDIFHKPLDMDIIGSKIINYLNPEGVKQEKELPYKTVAAIQSDIFLKLNLKISTITEQGIILLSNNFIPKGTVVKLSGAMIVEIENSLATQSFEIYQNHYDEKLKVFLCYINFNKLEKTVQEKISNWIRTRNKKTGE
ncbi:MAG: hypothetical protein HQK53_09010 [Oligoflexia bacterium]|nr:hypothetical protein [Oligoflexia bacterium]